MHIDVGGRALPVSMASVGELTPEETTELRKAGAKLLDAEADERFMHTKAIVVASGGRIRG